LLGEIDQLSANSHATILALHNEEMRIGMEKSRHVSFRNRDKDTFWMNRETVDQHVNI